MNTFEGSLQLRRYAKRYLVGGIAGAAVIALMLANDPSSNAGQPPTHADQIRQLDAKIAASNVVSPPVTALGRDLGNTFRVLRASGPAMPASIVALMKHSQVAASYGVNVALARPIGSGHDAWVIPGNTGLCLWLTDPVDGGGVGCATTAQAAAGNLSISLVGGGAKPTAHVVGLLPDGVSTATVATAGSSSGGTAVAVSGNGWETTVSDAPHQLTFSSGGVAHTVPAA